MGGDGAEGTAAETAAMDIHAVLDHVVGGYALALVFTVVLYTLLLPNSCSLIVSHQSE